MSDTVKKYLKPEFLICVGLLLVSAVSLKSLVECLGTQLSKYPLPLVNSLDDIDEEAIKPYKVVRRGKIASKEIEEELGTSDYIQWNIEDTTVNADSPVRFCNLFITYYDLPDRIPHVPEECYFGAGNQRVSLDDITFTLDIANSNVSDNGKLRVPVRHLVFLKKGKEIWDSSVKMSVLYTLRVNGRYAGGRGTGRSILQQNVFGKYSYFSKVEWRFFNNVGAPASAKETNDASKRMLETILPVLEKEHWPDFDKVNAEFKKIDDDSGSEIPGV